VASVASVTGVAGVAGVAGGVVGKETQTDRRQDLGTDPSPQHAIRDGDDRRSGALGRDAHDDWGRTLDRGGKPTHEHHDAAPAGDSTANAYGAVNGDRSAAKVTGVAQTAPASAATASEPAQRIADIQQRRADAPATPLNRMTLRIDGAAGTPEQIIVDLRGQAVHTQITTDTATADRMRLRTADLQEALGRHGLESEGVRITGTIPQNGSTADGHGDYTSRSRDPRDPRDPQRQQERARRTPFFLGPE